MAMGARIIVGAPPFPKGGRETRDPQMYFEENFARGHCTVMLIVVLKLTPSLACTVRRCFPAVIGSKVSIVFPRTLYFFTPSTQISM